VVVGDLARWLRDEEAAGSNPATPTQVTGLLVQCQLCPASRFRGRQATCGYFCAQ
jgi:hypothetical protein